MNTKKLSPGPKIKVLPTLPGPDVKDLPFVSDHKTDQPKKINLVDLFAGIGGFHYGISDAASKFQRSVKPILVSEIDQGCRDVYKTNFDYDPQGDNKKINLDEFKNLRADIVTAGFPCQPFSNSGRKLGLQDPRGRFYNKIEEIILYFSAKSFILENVTGIIKNGGGSYDSIFAHHPQKIGRTLHSLEMKLSKLTQYHIKWIEIDSSDLGSPQVRKRIYIIGLHKDYADEFNLVFKPFKKHPFTAIADKSPALKSKNLQLSESQERNIRQTMQRQAPSYKNGMRRVGNAYLCKGGNVGQAYHAHGMVPTLTKVWAGFLPIYFPLKEEGKPLIGQREFIPCDEYGNGIIRKASISEVMRLQGFPLSFVPHQNNRLAYEQAGNAVNAKVVREIAELLLQYIIK